MIWSPSLPAFRDALAGEALLVPSPIDRPDSAAAVGTTADLVAARSGPRGARSRGRRTSPTARQARIVAFFQRRPYFSTLELSRMLHVSTMTVRRDLQELARIGALVAVHGGARLDRPAAREPDLSVRAAENRLEKEAIGAYAAAMIEPGEAICVDAGSTALEVARRLKPSGGLSVVTNSLPVMVELSRHNDITLVALGGTLLGSPLAFSGPAVVAALSALHFSTLILEASGIDFSLGMTSTDLTDAEIKRVMIRAAERVIVVADHTKIGRKLLAKVGPLEAGHILVTDDGIEDEHLQHLRRLGMEVHTAAVDTHPATLIASSEGP